jgi:hypothetical protein
VPSNTSVIELPNNPTMTFVLTSDLQTWFKETHDIDITSIPSSDGMKWIKNKNIFLKKIFGNSIGRFWEPIDNNKELKTTLLQAWEERKPRTIPHGFNVDSLHYPEFSRILSIEDDIRANKHRKYYSGAQAGLTAALQDEKEDVLDYLSKQGGNLLSEIIDIWIKENPGPQLCISIYDLIPPPESDSESEEKEDSGEDSDDVLEYCPRLDAAGREYLERVQERCAAAGRAALEQQQQIRSVTGV